MYTGIAGDTPTLTFTPTKAGEIVIGLTINYEEVELTDEILNGSLKLEFVDQSFIVSAKFGDIKDYSDSLLDEYYDALVAKDDQLLNNTEAIDAEDQGDYYDITLAAKVEAEKVAVGKVIAAFKKTDTISEKVAAVQKAVATSEKAIDTAYATLIAAAKVKALAEVVALYESTMAVSGLGYEKENRVAFEAAAKEAVNAATTLAGIGEVIDANGTAGQYGVLEGYRLAAMNKINAYVASVETSDPAFAEGTTDAEKLAHKTLLETLATYGITELPSDVATKQLKSLSALSSFTKSTEKTTATKSVEGDAALKAVTDSYEGIINTLKTSIRAAYDKEIYASKVIVETKDRDNVSSIVGTAISEWCEQNKAALKVSSMVSYDFTADTDTTDDDPELTNDGLLGYIENELTVASNPSLISTAFVNERLGTARTAQIAALKAKLDGYLADAEYKNAVSYISSDAYTALTDADKATKYTAKTIGTTTVYYLTNIGLKNHTVANVIGGVDTYDVAKLYATDVPTGTNPTTGIYGKTTVLEINEYATTQLAAYGIAYEAAVAKYAGDQVAAEVVAADATTGTPVSHTEAQMEAVVSAYIKDSKVATLDGVDTVIASVDTWVECIKELDLKFNEFVNGAGDLVLSNDVGAKSETNEFYKSYLDELDAITAGTVTTAEQVDAWADGLKTTYKSSISAYLTKYKTIFTDSYKAYLAGTPASTAAELQAMYSAYIELAGTTDYPCDSYTAVQNWYNNGIRKLDIVKGTVKNLLSADTDNSLGAATVISTSYAGGLTLATEDGLTEGDEKYDGTINIGGKTATITKATAGTLGFGDKDKAENGNLYISGFKLGKAISAMTGYDINKAYIAFNGTVKYCHNADTTKGQQENVTEAYDGEFVFAVKKVGTTSVVVEFSPDGITSYKVLVNITVGTLGA